MPWADATLQEVEQVKPRTEEELAAIKALQMPKFIPPYPVKTNPHAETAIAEAIRWTHEHNLPELYRESTLPKLYSHNAAAMPTKLYTECDADECAWSSKFFVWFFVLDDQMDDEEYYQNPEKAISLCLELNLIVLWSFPDDPILLDNLQHFFDKAPQETRQTHTTYVEAKLAKARTSPGTAYDTSKSGPLCSSLGSLWQMVVEAKSPQFCLRWGRSIQTYLIGNADESTVRKGNHIPSIAEYIPMRRKSVGMDPSMVIIEYLDKVDLSEELFQSPEMQDLLLTMSDVASWHNDLWSFKKERLLGDVHNLIYLISLESKCSFVEASNIALQMLKDSIAHSELVSEALIQLAAPADKPAIQQYIKLCHTFISGCEDWYSSSKRYTC